MKSGVTRTDHRNARTLVWESLKKLGDQHVLVGIPESASARDDSTINNAQIGYQNEFGSPALNIPPRPHLEPGVRSAGDQTTPLLRKAALASLNGDQQEVHALLNQVGLVAVSKVEAYIQNANFVPLSTATVQKRAEGGRAGAQKELDYRMANGFTPSSQSNYLARPLIDTENYINAIQYVVVGDRNNGETAS